MNTQYAYAHDSRAASPSGAQFARCTITPANSNNRLCGIQVLRALPRTTELTILGRLLTSGKKAMSPPLARHILGLGSTPSDQARMRELAERNQDSLLTPEEQEELRSYVKAL